MIVTLRESGPGPSPVRDRRRAMSKPYSGRRVGGMPGPITRGRPKGNPRRWARPQRPLGAPAVPREPESVPEPEKATAPTPEPETASPVKPVEIDPEGIDWSRLLKDARVAWDQTIEQAAEDLDVSVTTFKRWESGKGKPGLKARDRIIEAVVDFTDLNLADYA